MGNNSSAHSHYMPKDGTHRDLDGLKRDQFNNDWTKSLPSNIKSKADRNEHPMWVLPTDIKHGLKLRSTMNGAIIQRGGTISGKNFTKHEMNGGSASGANVISGMQFRRTHTMLEFDGHAKLAASAVRPGHEPRQKADDKEAAVEPESAARDASNVSEKKYKLYKKRKAPAVPQTATSAKCTTQMLDHQPRDTGRIVAHLKANGESLPLASHSPCKKHSDDELREAPPESVKMHRTEFAPKNAPNGARHWEPAQCTYKKAAAKVENVVAAQAKGSEFNSIGDLASSLLTDALRRPGGVVDEAIISAHVRPTLPRRQLDIPSFSPFTAWRLLRIDEQCLDRGISPGGRDQPESQVEEKFPFRFEIQQPQDKPKILMTSWTPQQDLDDDDDDLRTVTSLRRKEVHAIAQATIEDERKPSAATRPITTYVLSLPRERQIFSHLRNSINMNESKCKSLEKTRRATGTTQSNTGSQTLFGNTNWFLHHSQAQIRSLDPAKPIQPVSLAYVKSGKHSIYLPKDEKDCSGEQQRDASTGFLSVVESSSARAGEARDQQREKPLKRTKNDRQSMQDSSYTAAAANTYSHPELSQPSGGPIKVASSPNRLSIHSTIITNLEKRRANQKLIKDSHTREVQRQAELEAMKRIEADFQWKRANEKAELRERMQVYLSSIDTNVCKHEDVQKCSTIAQRAEPDGADDRYVLS